MVCVVNVIAATHTEMSPEVVEFKNIGCGQCILNITVAVDHNDHDVYDMS